MARPKKEEKVDKEDAPIDEVTKEAFLHQRDSVVTALTTVKATVDGFLNSYIRHTNALLGIKTDTALGSLDVTAGLLGSTPTPAAPEAKKERKKREKKIRDPNAPKRPLTAFFLFTANARGLIREDLREAGTGEEPKGGAIAKEAERRWAELPEDEKENWRVEYRKNLDIWKAEMAEYTATKGEPFEIEAHDEDMADADGVGTAALEDEDEDEDEKVVEADDDDDDDDDEEDEDDEPPPPPPKEEPKKKKAKTGKESSAASASTPTVAPSKVSKVPLPGSNGASETKESKKIKKAAEEGDVIKKKSKKSKGAAEASADAEVGADESIPAATPVSEKKEKKRKRAAKE